MIRTDEDALICDLAETYHIYDYKQLPATLVAVFSFGLPESSRIKLKMSGQLVPLETMLLAGISDTVSMLLWINSKDGQKGVNRPSSTVSALTNQSSKNESVAFNSGEDFERVRNKLLAQIAGGE